MMNQLESGVDNKEIIVVDPGTYTIKIGSSGDDHPLAQLEPISGFKGNKHGEFESLASAKGKNFYGKALDQIISEKKVEVNYRRFIERGKIESLELTKELLEYALNSIYRYSEFNTCNLLIVDSITNSKDYKHSIAEYLFEEMRINSLLFMNSSTLSLYSTGETTGLVIESGEGISTVTPGYPIYHALQSSFLGGQDIQKYMTDMLMEKLPKVAEFVEGKHDLEKSKIFRNIKEGLAEIAGDIHISLSRKGGNDEDFLYELPDGQVIRIDEELKYKPTEILFDPSIINSNEMSMKLMIEESITRCDDELQRDIFQNVIVCGGTSMTKGFANRIQKEISYLFPQQERPVTVGADSFRKNAAWIGGSMMGSLATFQSLAITKSEYDENPEGKIALFHKRTF